MFLDKNAYPVTHCKDLVVWGTNLEYTFNLPKFNKMLRYSINIPAFQYSVIIGLILSDAGLRLTNTIPKYNKINNRNARLEFGQAFAKYDYFMHVFSIIGHYSSSFPKLRRGERKGTPTFWLAFQTRSLPCFTQLYHMFYTNSIKIIPNDIFNLLDPISLAHLIMGDGSRQGNGLKLCTNSFTLQDTRRLMNVLVKRYGLICSIHKTCIKNQYVIYISAKSRNTLKNIVLPYMVPSMLYKLGL